jgi:hypothetical protein
MNSRRLGQLKFAEKLHQGAAAQPLEPSGIRAATAWLLKFE